MMKNFTSFSKRLLLAAVALVSVSSAFAGDDPTYYPYKYDVEVLPTGAGLVYSNGDEDIRADEITDWQESVHFADASETLLTFTYVNVFGKPNDGWLWSGVAYAEKDENGVYQIMRNEDGTIKVSDANNPAEMQVDFHSNSYSSLAAAKAALADIASPDTVMYALFCRVRPDFASGHQKAGVVYSSNPINDMGDEVELTAVPTREGGEFLYWTKNDKENGERITDNPLKVTVNETATYYAHFTATGAVQFTGDEGWMIWYRPTTMLLSEDGAVTGYRFQEKNFVDKNDEETGNRLSYFSKMEDTTYSLYGSVPHIINVTAPTLMVDNLLEPGATITKNYSVGGWTGEEGLDTDLVEAENYYYLCDLESRSFKLCTDYVLPANKFYLAIPVGDCTAGEDAPQVVYFSLEDALQGGESDGIEAVDIENAVNAGRVYNLGGMEVLPVGKGVYILNGKKFINK